MLRGEALTLAYEKRVVSDGLDVDIPEGSFTVIVGPNACGKSTLLRGLARMLKPRGGTVLLDGQRDRLVSLQGGRAPARDAPAELYRARRRSRSPPSSRGAATRTSGCCASGRARTSARCDAAMDATGVDDLVRRPVDELSGGQRQRVWLAMVLAQQTPILLLDEPTTFLDIAHQIEMLDLCAELHAYRAARSSPCSTTSTTPAATPRT